MIKEIMFRPATIHPSIMAVSHICCLARIIDNVDAIDQVST